MRSTLLVAIAVLCNVSAQLALKKGSGTDLSRWQNWLSLPLLAGLGLYGLSFLFTIRIYSSFPLSFISPVMAGAIFLLTTIGSAAVFDESLTFPKFIGIALIVAGIAVLSRFSAPA